MSGKEDIAVLLDNILNDRGVPRNVKTSIEEALEILRDSKSNNIKIAECVSILEEVTTDPNLSSYSRTVLWDAVSKLESIK